MDDAVSRYLSASEAADVEGIGRTLAAEVELVSPISGRMTFRGRDDVLFLLGEVYGTLKDLRWTETIGEGPRRVALAQARLGGVRMSDAMVLELGADGLIRRIAPHLRPWLALTLFAVVLGPKVGRRPALVRRALVC